MTTRQLSGDHELSISRLGRNDPIKIHRAGRTNARDTTTATAVRKTVLADLRLGRSPGADVATVLVALSATSAAGGKTVIPASSPHAAAGTAAARKRS